MPPILLVAFTFLFVTKHIFLSSLEKSWNPPTRRSVGLPELSKDSFLQQQQNYTFTDETYPLQWPLPPLKIIHTLIERTSVHFRLDDADDNDDGTEDTASADAEWEALIPGDDGKGMIYLGENDLPFSISMVHQLRCLGLLRRGVVASWEEKGEADADGGGGGASGSASRVIKNNGASGASGRARDGDGDGNGDRTDHHLEHHCVNYLRQMVLCRSTMDADSIMGKSTPNAFPDIYKCRDWEEVYDAVKENQRVYGEKMKRRSRVGV